MIIKVRVRPGSSKQEVIKTGAREFIVLLKERAEEGRANLELIKVLKKYFKGRFNETYHIKNKFFNTQTSKKKHEVYDIKIIKGLKGRNKIVEVIKNGDKI